CSRLRRCRPACRSPASAWTTRRTRRCSLPGSCVYSARQRRSLSSTLDAMMTLDDQLLNEAKTVRERLLDLQYDVERARVDYQHVIRQLHAKGGSMREIAEELGLSHQRVHQIVDAGPEDARGHNKDVFFYRRRGGGRPFGRLTRYARSAVEQAHEESEELGHGYIGTEHLLLGLLKTEDGGAARALQSLGVRYDDSRAKVAAVE